MCVCVRSWLCDHVWHSSAFLCSSSDFWLRRAQMSSSTNKSDSGKIKARCQCRLPSWKEKRRLCFDKIDPRWNVTHTKKDTACLIYQRCSCVCLFLLFCHFYCLCDCKTREKRKMVSKKKPVFNLKGLKCQFNVFSRLNNFVMSQRAIIRLLTTPQLGVGFPCGRPTKVSVWMVWMGKLQTAG